MKLSGSTKKLLVRIVLFLLYLVIGAGIFMAIEKGPEQVEREKANKFIDKVNGLTNNTFNSSAEVKQFLLDFKHALDYGYDINLNKLELEKWTYMNSFYFVGNIVTTIGRLDRQHIYNARNLVILMVLLRGRGYI